jgi:hypothetical protein
MNKCIKIDPELVNKQIERVYLDDNDIVVFNFKNKKKVLELFDGNQICCEKRYLEIDDDLSFFSGAKLQNIIEKKIKINYSLGNGDIREILFIDVVTSKGIFQVKAYNEHSGYYSGFNPVLRTTNLEKPFKIEKDNSSLSVCLDKSLEEFKDVDCDGIVFTYVPNENNFEHHHFKLSIDETLKLIENLSEILEGYSRG